MKKLDKRLTTLEVCKGISDRHNPISIMVKAWNELTEAAKDAMREKHSTVIIINGVPAKNGKPYQGTE